jgi:hypothetical protein
MKEDALSSTQLQALIAECDLALAALPPGHRADEDELAGYSCAIDLFEHLQVRICVLYTCAEISNPLSVVRV